MVAPDSARSGLVEHIRAEVAHHQAGRPGRIRIKANSIVDEAVIDALYHASQAGVQVDLLIRAICAVRPGVPGLSENIRVRSILGRFLEHSRIYWFGNGGEPRVYIGSADMMHRNLDRRVEVLVRLPTQAAIDQVTSLLDLAFDPHTSAWELAADGSWARAAAGEEPLIDLQETLIAQHTRRRAK
jgi:polyphosphate kinase